jgi:DNA-binding response OmpR family regulator
MTAQVARRGVDASVRTLRWPYRVVAVESASCRLTHTAPPVLLDHGIELRPYADGPAALLALLGEDPVAVLAPTDLVGVDFLRFVSAVVAWSDVAVIVALSDDPDSHSLAFAALELGARGIVGLPFTPTQLVASLRHLGCTNTTAAGLQHGPLELDRQGHQARLGDASVLLAPRDFTLLEFLLSEAPRVVSLAEIGTVLGEATAPADPARVRKSVQVLRRKLARVQPDHRPIIESVRGLGYRLADLSTDSRDLP